MWGKRRLLLGCLAALVAGSVIAALSSSLAPLLDRTRPAGSGHRRRAAGHQSHARPPAPAAARVGHRRDECVARRRRVVGFAAVNVARAVRELAVAVLGLRRPCGPGRVARAGRRHRVAATDRRTVRRAGAVLLTASVTCLFLTISKGGRCGWTSQAVVLLAGSAVVLLVAFGAWELRARQPLIDLRAGARCTHPW
jgi:hypothetical protein